MFSIFVRDLRKIKQLSTLDSRLIIFRYIWKQEKKQEKQHKSP